MAELNAAQQEAVRYIDGPALVIAGAGSGKTRVLTFKLAYLIERGYTPWHILALTFTNKAAREMKERVAQIVGAETAREVWMGTFHSIFARILRIEAEAIGFQASFTIYDETDSRSLLKAIIKEMELDDKVYRPATVHSRISWAKNRAQWPEDYARDSYSRERDKNTDMEAVADIYKRYQQRLRQADAMDFDDLLLYTLRLFKERDDIRGKWAARFQYVLVDEYQDTNHVQAEIVAEIARDHKRVCAVGDDSQSIYSFRGADINNILSFQRTFSTEQVPVRLFKLEQNYRSTQNIVNAANSLIAHNAGRIPKTVFSEKGAGERILLRLLYTDREEAAAVSRDIRRLQKRDHLTPSDFAILYRTNAQSRVFEEQLRRDAMPYRIYGGLSFYQRKEIKDIVAYLRLTVNPHDEEALRRVINYPARGIGATTIDKVMARAIDLGRSPWDVVADPVSTGLNVNKGTATKLRTFATLIASFAERAATTDAATLGKAIILESGTRDDIFHGHEPDDVARQENVEELVNSMAQFVDSHVKGGEAEHVLLSDFLQEVSLMSDLDSPEDTDDRITLMTIHSAKGLEFPIVFIVGMEEELLPSANAMSPKAIEEERRLLYVAITRAERLCTLTAVEKRYRYGQEKLQSPSRFIRDIDQQYIETVSGGRMIGERMTGSAGLRPASLTADADLRRTSSSGYGRERWASPSDDKQTKVNTSGFPPYNNRPSLRKIVDTPRSTIASAGGRPTLSLTPGQRIEHDRFGQGTVVSVEGAGENRKARINFDQAGIKQLLLKFAKITTL